MSQTKAHPASIAGKPKDAKEAAPVPDSAEAAIPNPEGSTHAHSHAAHLDTAGTPETKPAAMLREDRDPTTLKEPPHLVNRAGKEHRRQ